ncbi:hypothetical protein [Lihuaxuella thermophila]|uniref:Uncharacterized protein n=1 Tax=Lihuaxuella thermophila TaxID=1173111 RepID=A0A1H8HH61_9BACL|nr:hypothetical protein [Lihuaxuella thermophila]SEN55493.1 hypothetical protein SAMN05444955_11430 [Lihuaxuella thermophila]
MQRKWMIYYVIVILVFLLGRWLLIEQFHFDTGKPSETGRELYLYWVNGFAVLFLGPAFYWTVRKWTKMVKEKIPSAGLRVLTLFYSIVFLVFLFLVVYYSLILSF